MNNSAILILDQYKDPLDDIRKKRVEREKIEKELQKQREAARLAKLEKMGRRIPLIIVTQYDDPDKNSSEYESEESTGKEKIPIPVMPSWGDIENTSEEIENDNGQGSVSCERGEFAENTVGNENENLDTANLVSKENDSQGDGVQASETVEESDRVSLVSNSLTQLAPPTLSSLNPSDDNSLLDKITSADDTGELY